METEQSLNILFWISTSVMLFLALAFLFITLLYHKKTSNIKQKEAENLLKATLEAEKNERQRIASDFHDSVSGDLSALRNFINILYQKEEENQDKAILDEIKHSLDIMMTNVKHINYNLMPPLLESMGLIPTLKDYIQRLENLNNIEISKDISLNKIDINNSDAYQLFRVIQELISNILNHNNASKIEISIFRESENVILCITDNGRKFNFFNNLKESKGLGLRNIISRLKNINADLKQVDIDNGNKLIVKIKENK